VAEQVRHRRRAREQNGVRRQLLNGVGLARAAGPELDEVEVLLTQRHQAQQEQELEPPIHDRRLVAHAAQHEVHPLVRGELAAQPPVVVELEGRELNRRDLLDPERVLAAVLFVVLEPHVHLRPDAAGEQPVEVTNVVLGDVDVLVAEVGELGPIVGVDEAHPDLVDERPAASLFDLALGLHRLVRADVVLGEGVVHHLKAHLDRHLVRRRAVFAEQELQDKHRHVRADLHLTDEVFADDTPGEDAVDLVIKRVALWEVAHESLSSAHLGATALTTLTATTRRGHARRSCPRRPWIAPSSSFCLALVAPAP
jgi:hypothetical protein